MGDIKLPLMNYLLYLSSSKKRENSQFEVKPPASGKSSRRKSGRKSARTSQDRIDPMNPDITSISSSRTVDNDSDLKVLGARLNDIENEVKRDNRNESRTDSLGERLSEFPYKPPSARKKWDPPAEELKPKTRPDSAQTRPKSTKSRPQTGSRAQSRQGGQSRAGSRQGSRPSSRANSRIGSSRAASRVEK